VGAEWSASRGSEDNPVGRQNRRPEPRLADPEEPCGGSEVFVAGLAVQVLVEGGIVREEKAEETEAVEVALPGQQVTVVGDESGYA